VYKKLNNYQEETMSKININTGLVCIAVILIALFVGCENPLQTKYPVDQMEKEDETAQPAGSGACHDDFRIGLWLSDHEPGDHTNEGLKVYTEWASKCYTGNTPYWSPWASDDNGHDPDYVSICLYTDVNETTKDIDFKVGIMVADNGIDGEPVYTPWASDIVGSSSDIRMSGWATDSGNAYDFDKIRVCLVVRDKPGFEIGDMRLGIRLSDDVTFKKGITEFTPKLTGGGGWSNWASTPDEGDPDGVQIWLDVKRATYKIEWKIQDDRYTYIMKSKEVAVGGSVVISTVPYFYVQIPYPYPHNYKVMFSRWEVKSGSVSFSPGNTSSTATGTLLSPGDVYIEPRY
jgi:hypothetical protein